MSKAKRLKLRALGWALRLIHSRAHRDGRDLRCSICLNEDHEDRARYRCDCGLKLVQGMVFGGFIQTVCVFDGQTLVRRVSSACCHRCAWDEALAWMAEHKRSCVLPQPTRAT